MNRTEVKRFTLDLERGIFGRCDKVIYEHSHTIEVDWSSRNPGFMGNWNPETNNVEKRNVSGAGT